MELIGGRRGVDMIQGTAREWFGIIFWKHLCAVHPDYLEKTVIEVSRAFNVIHMVLVTD